MSLGLPDAGTCGRLACLPEHRTQPERQALSHLDLILARGPAWPFQAPGESAGTAAPRSPLTWSLQQGDTAVKTK